MPDKRCLSEKDFLELTEPTLRLFLSVDLEGSTRLKQELGRSSSKWMADISLFYNNFLSLLDSQIEERAKKLTSTPRRPPIWKILGDEIIFVEKICDKEDLCFYVGAFHAALACWNDDLARGDEERGKLRIKGAAWIAGFPVCNAVIEIPGEAEDYTGPSIDAGFRLCKMSDPRRFAISVDLAWLLIEGKFPETIYFDGTASLKGVADDTGYPILWIDVGSSNYIKIEHELKGRSACTHSKVKELCRHFIVEYGVPAHLPFIGSQRATVPPPDNYQSELDIVRDFLKKEIFLVIADTEEGISPDQGERQALLDQLNPTKKSSSENYS